MMRNDISEASREIGDRLAGVYCGIPLCCIDFFIKESRKAPLVALRVGESRGNWNSVGAKYVQCDDCYQKNKYVELRGVGVGRTPELLFNESLSVMLF